MIAPARLAAYDVVRAVSTNRADLPAALARSRRSLPDPRDQALAAEIATGVLRWRGELDHLIGHFAGRPLSRFDPEVLDILRLSAYQILHLDRIPASAAVSDAVELTRRVGKRSASGLVNAVLRAISRGRDALPLPVRPPGDGIAPGTGDFDRALDYLSVTLSHPRWLAARWLRRYGFAAAAVWTEFDNAPAPITLRANRLKIDRPSLVVRLAEHGVQAEPTRYAPDGLVVIAGNPLATPVAESGLFFVQDEASQLVGLLARAAPGEIVLDACASPGGKTTALAAELQDTGLVVACDVRERRVELLQRTVELSGSRCVRIARTDLSQGLPFAPRFDCVLVDAPCSGLGTIRRDPDVRWRRQEADLARFAETQGRMLSHAAAGVRPGGRLLYATCSSEPEENEEVVVRFLGAHPDFRALDPRTLSPAIPPGLAAVIDPAGHLHTYPHRHGLEAFFGALLQRAGEARRA